MDILWNIVRAIQVLSALGMIGLILMQHGKGADAGAAFGGGGSGSASLFGASGSANFLSRATAGLATTFLVCTLGLSYFGHVRVAPSSSGSVLEGSVLPAAAPASGAAPAAEPASAPQGAAKPTPSNSSQVPGQ